jgi:hypothetical protein
MAVTASPLTGDRQLRGDEIPASRLAEPLTLRHLPAIRKLGSRHRRLEWLDAEDGTSAQRQQQLGEALQRGRLDPALDPTDRVLAGPRPQREAALAEPLLLARLAEDPTNL